MIPQSRYGIWLATLGLALAPLTAAATPHQFPSASSITRADELVGRLVETRDGEELGRVRNLALDLSSGQVAYVVIAVASFLIDDGLIAVEPGALRASADADGRLVLETDAESLRAARRFSGSDWPLRADIVAGSSSPPRSRPNGSAADTAADGVDTAAEGAASGRGSAVISDGSRTATLSAGERSIRQNDGRDADGSGAGREASAAPSAFDRLDRDGSGTLDRAEIAHELRPGDSFSAIDSNNDGVIQRDEYEAWQSSAGRRGSE
ncbi:MAG: PRC-barrel domain-containing protein [Pseudomonadales bacterium]